MRRVKEAVPMAECKRRVMTYMSRKQYGTMIRAYEVAGEIWPGVKFTSQGAGAAASRILSALARDGVVRWLSKNGDWGWILK